MQVYVSDRLFYTVERTQNLEVQILPCLPTEPQFNKDQPLFTHINSTHARLNLQGWSSGGCPINTVLLDFRPKGTYAWQSIRTNGTADVFLAELREATWYELKMKACNSAGCGNQTSQFATLDYDGSELANQNPFTVM